MLKFQGVLPKALLAVSAFIALMILTEWKHTSNFGIGGFLVGVFLFLPLVGIIYYGLNLVVALNVFMFDKFMNTMKKP